MTAKHHVEILESDSIGFMDDGFRSGWTLESGSGSFANQGTIAGDYARMSTTSDVHFKRSIESLGLETDTYPVLRARMRGGQSDAYCEIVVYYTDGSWTASGWFAPGTSWMIKDLELAAGKTIKEFKLGLGWGAKHIDWDYLAILKHPPLIPEEIEELEVDLQTTVGVSGFRILMLNDPLLESTLLRFPFDEGFGSKAYDLSPGRNHGDISGASWVDGKYGKCLQFASGDYVDVPAGKIDLSGRKVVVYRAWIKLDDPGASHSAIIDWGSGRCSLMATGSSWGNTLTFYVNWHGTTAGGDAMAGKWGDWTFVVVVFDDDADTVTFYINGERVATVEETNSIPTSTEHTRIGRYCDGSWPSVGLIDEPMILTRKPTDEEVLQWYLESPLSGAQRAGVGDIVMVYLAGEGESLDEKLIKGRIIDRERRGDPDNPLLELVGESLDEILQERTYTEEFASPTQISEIVRDIVDDTLPEFTRASIDDTNLAIKNRFEKEEVFGLLKKLAETVQYSDGTWGANFWVDPGGDLHFEKLGKWTGPKVTDGSDGSEKNILDITVRETMKGNPKLANDIKVVYFEAEHVPENEDAWTDVEGDQDIGWSVVCDYPEYVEVRTNSTDKKSGENSIEFHITANPGNNLKMRLVLPRAEDISTIDKLRFWFKRTSGIVIESVDVYLDTKGSWLGKYYSLTGLEPPDYDTWHEYVLNISDFTKHNNPNQYVTRISIEINSPVGIGVNDIRIDKLRFERSEKYKQAEDSTSIAKYGRRKEVVIDKTITDPDYAQYLANGMLRHRKNPTVQIRAKVLGKAQPGFRPPQKVQVYSLKDGLNGEYFQITSARHHIKPDDIYTCELNLIAAKEPAGTYEPKIVPQPEPESLGGWLAVLRFLVKIMGLSTLRREWK